MIIFLLALSGWFTMETYDSATNRNGSAGLFLFALVCFLFCLSIFFAQMPPLGGFDH